MPDFPIVDTHLHLWDPSKLNYGWLKGSKQLFRAFLPEDFKTAIGKVNVEKAVFVQCDCDAAQAVQEAEWVASLATRDERIKGIVAYAPLHEGAKVETALAKLAENKLVKGIRRICQGEADLEFATKKEFIEGVQALKKFNFSFDHCIKYTQLPAAIKMAEACPDVKIILDHIGKPDIKSGKLEPWNADIKKLAALPNVFCKISGLVTEADLTQWKPEDLRPYILQVIESFGISRVMFGGDWPVCTLACEYPRWVDALDAALRGTPVSDQHKLYRENAVSFYKL